VIVIEDLVIQIINIVLIITTEHVENAERRLFVVRMADIVFIIKIVVILKNALKKYVKVKDFVISTE
jgi:hypothetical protein